MFQINLNIIIAPTTKRISGRVICKNFSNAPHHQFLQLHKDFYQYFGIEPKLIDTQMESVSRYQKLLQQLALDLGFLLG